MLLSHESQIKFSAWRVSDDVSRANSQLRQWFPEPVSSPTKVQAEESQKDGSALGSEEYVGTAIITVGSAISLLLKDPEEEVDKLKLLEYLSDTGKLLAETFHQHSAARKAYMTPVMKKSVKTLVDSIHSEECLDGDKLADQIKEAKTIERKLKRPVFSIQTDGPSQPSEIFALQVENSEPQKSDIYSGKEPGLHGIVEEVTEPRGQDGGLTWETGAGSRLGESQQSPRWNNAKDLPRFVKSPGQDTLGGLNKN
ncbi:Protein of unknown function [Cotesia congregata]|uniref:Uncharacterized protein n=1 Tax=Cotesia congregata TaxID=51543 RepID=A0A8J2MZD3_COTCN|nr:Protein of unknown function [Cotesia congregata]